MWGVQWVLVWCEEVFQWCLGDNRCEGEFVWQCVSVRGVLGGVWEVVDARVSLKVC